VALPVSSIDWEMTDGLREIPIEERDPAEVREMVGLRADGAIERISLFSEESPVCNPAFDVTPAEYVTGLITEYGLIRANREDLTGLRGRAGLG
jgi:methylthioribose-1-phosphate isomerase